MVGESWPSQNRAGSSSVYKAFTSPPCHIKGDMKLHWCNEDGSSGIWKLAGSQPLQLVCGNLSSAVSWGCPLGIPQEGAQTFSLPVRLLLTEETFFQAQVASWLLSSLLSPLGSSWCVGWIRAAKSCVFFISLLLLLAASIKSQILLSTEKKNAQHENCELFSLGLIEDYSLGDSILDCPKKLLQRGGGGGGSQYVCDFGEEGEYRQSSTHFCRRLLLLSWKLLLVMRSRHHHLWS